MFAATTLALALSAVVTVTTQEGREVAAGEVSFVGSCIIVVQEREIFVAEIEKIDLKEDSPDGHNVIEMHVRWWSEVVTSGPRRPNPRVNGYTPTIPRINVPLPFPRYGMIRTAGQPPVSARGWWGIGGPSRFDVTWL